ncbi:MAG: hypothetical protein ABIQ88_12865 [Chitinophagaceae bacterium]
MASIGKKILSAFVDVTDDKPPVKNPAATSPAPTSTGATQRRAADNSKFREYFEKLFEDANLPGPDYYEFSKMIGAMNSIPDEQARFTAAFAGLRVQGLDKQKLLATAADYLAILEKDAGNFLSTVDAAVEEKVVGRQKAIADKSERIKQLSQEMSDLQNQVAVLYNEVKENEEKLAQSSDGYREAIEIMKGRILHDTEKIKSFIQ